MGYWFKYIILLFVFVGCELFHDNTQFDTSRRDFDQSFDKVVLADHVDLILVQDVIDYVVINTRGVKSDEVNILEKGSVLEISSNTSERSFKGYSDLQQVELHFTELGELFLKGSGYVSSLDTLKMEQLLISANQSGGSLNMKINMESLNVSNATGSTSYTISGKTKNLVVFSDAAYGPILAGGLESSFVSISSNGANKIQLQVLDFLRIRATHLARIEYLGNPEIEIIEKGDDVKIISLNP